MNITQLEKKIIKAVNQEINVAGKVGINDNDYYDPNIELEKLKQFISKEQPDYNVEETKAASEFTVFNRAWHYIKQIDLNKEDHLSAIIQFNKDPFIPALEAAINYFEDPDVEQYERCAFLFKILDLKKQV